MITGLYQINAKDHFRARTVHCMGFSAQQAIVSDSQDGVWGAGNGLIREVDVTVTDSERRLLGVRPWTAPFPGCCS